jgi:hypothetical protein
MAAMLVAMLMLVVLAV